MAPPHVAGPSGFRDMLDTYNHAVVFKIDVPTETLLSDDRLEVFQQLHEIAAKLEMAATEMGCPSARAFAGGSCKQIFCHDHAECRVLKDGSDCRFPRRARPSMSGFGINVTKLMRMAGWTLQQITAETDPDAVPVGSVTGLVLVC